MAFISGAFIRLVLKPHPLDSNSTLHLGVACPRQLDQAAQCNRLQICWQFLKIRKATDLCCLI